MNTPQTLTSLFLLAATTAGAASLSRAQEYPFPLPAQVTATLNVGTTVTEKANNHLLGVNLGGPRNQPIPGGKGYNESEFYEKFDPIAVRWPQGVWSNFYDYLSDGRRRNPAYDNKEFSPMIDGHQDLKYGFPTFTRLHNEMKFDVIWTYNLNDDSPQKSVARLKDSEAKGFDVKYIELGNEQFWNSQRGVQTATPEKYLKTAQQVSKALKAVKPDAQISIPLSWRDGKTGSLVQGRAIDHTTYNAALTKDQTYFDAISVHRYVHVEGEKKEISAAGYREILTAAVSLQKSVDWTRNFAPGKPVWLTEWGISAGEKAASYLGSADAYMFLFRNQDVYQYATWFQVNAYDPFYVWDYEGKILTPRQTGWGANYNIMRAVYEGAELLGSKVETTELAPGSNAVLAQAVVKAGKRVILAVNKTPQSVPMTLNFDGKPYKGTFTQKAMAFDNLAQDKTWAFDENPLKPVATSASIVLPPYSINVISDLDGAPKTAKMGG